MTGVVYRGLACLAEPVAGAVLRGRGEDAVLRAERLGRSSPEPAAVWWHAASVGEVAALEPVLARALARGVAACFAVTTTTATGRQAALQRWGDRVALAPLDVPGAVRRSLRARRPRDLVLVETELWPNWIREALRRGVRVSTVNGRISDRAWPRYRRWRGLFRPLLTAFTAVAARTQRDAERFLALGVPGGSLTVAGNTKVDRLAAPAEPARLPWTGDPVWVVGSLRPGEEETVLGAFLELRGAHPRLRLVLALRHPQDWGGLDGRLTAMGLVPARRSRLSGEDGRADLLVVDTHGELPALYAAGDVALVGGTFVPIGGHNVLEAAAAGVPVIVGPHVENVVEDVEALEKSGGALRVSGRAELVQAVGAFLKDTSRRNAAGVAARASVAALRGASDRALDWLQERGALGAD